MPSLLILYGSQTGNAENLAYTVGEELSEHGLDCQVLCMEDFDLDELAQQDTVLIVTSTHGDGEAPDNASELLSFLKFEDEVQLGGVRFSVLGLGDTYYPHFCQCAKDFDRLLEERGATRIAPRKDCDVYFEEQFGEWVSQVREALGV